MKFMKKKFKRKDFNDSVKLSIKSEIKLDIYRSSADVYIGSLDDLDVDESVKLAHLKSKGFMTSRGDKAIIWVDGQLKSKCMVSTLNHEITHFAISVVGSTGIRCTESIAYLVGYITDQIVDLYSKILSIEDDED